MLGLWEIGLAIVLGVAANLITPYFKSGFRRGFVGMRRFRAEMLEQAIADAHFYFEHPTWLVLHLLREFAYVAIVILVAASVSLILILGGYKLGPYYVALATLGHCVGVLYMDMRTYRRARAPKYFETKARAKIARLTGKKTEALESADSGPPPTSKE